MRGRELACAFLARVFQEQPREEFVARLAADDLFAEWPPQDGGEDTLAGVRLMRRFCAAWDARALPDLEADYNRLFVGPGLPLAPPWGSYYLSPDRLLFQEPTLAVREAYRRFGLEAPGAGSAPDDALGLELAFLAELYGRGCAEAAREFLEQHLAPWAPRCLGLVIEHARTDYYRGAAHLALGLLAAAG